MRTVTRGIQHGGNWPPAVCRRVSQARSHMRIVSAAVARGIGVSPVRWTICGPIALVSLALSGGMVCAHSSAWSLYHVWMFRRASWSSNSSSRLGRK